MADLKKAAGGRETPQGELRSEVVEDEGPRSPVAEEPGGSGSNSSETKLSPREEEELDPRIQEELEHLNQASEEINQVELQLDEARTTYRRILQESARKLNTQGSHLGSCIEKARPYYEARRLAKEAQQETQKAALRYERAVSMHNAAREMVFVAEQGVMADKNRLDPTWQEMLNHATCKVNEAEEERLRGEREHQRVTRLCQQAEARVQQPWAWPRPRYAAESPAACALVLSQLACEQCVQCPCASGRHHASLDGQELGAQSRGRRGSDIGVRGGRHQRSVSL